MPENNDLQRRLGSIEELLHKVEAAADPSLRSDVKELIELVMSLHGAAFERMFELMQTTGEPGQAVIQKLATDDLVSSLLVLYGLHPLNLERRVANALDKLRPRLRTHGAEVELLSIEEGAVRIQLEIKTQGCGSTRQTLKEMLEQALYQAAPDLGTLTIEGAQEKQSFVPLEMLMNSHAVPAGEGGL